MRTSNLVGSWSFPEKGSQDLMSISLSLRQADMKSSFNTSVELPTSQLVNLLLDILISHIHINICYFKYYIIIQRETESKSVQSRSSIYSQYTTYCKTLDDLRAANFDCYVKTKIYLSSVCTRQRHMSCPQGKSAKFVY